MSRRVSIETSKKAWMRGTQHQDQESSMFHRRFVMGYFTSYTVSTSISPAVAYVQSISS